MIQISKTKLSCISCDSSKGVVSISIGTVESQTSVRVCNDCRQLLTIELMGLYERRYK